MTGSAIWFIRQRVYARPHRKLYLNKTTELRSSADPRVNSMISICLPYSRFGLIDLRRSMECINPVPDRRRKRSVSWNPRILSLTGEYFYGPKELGYSKSGLGHVMQYIPLQYDR